MNRVRKQAPKEKAEHEKKKNVCVIITEDFVLFFK